MSTKRTESTESIEAQMNEDEILDLSNLEALDEALKPEIAVFPLHIGRKKIINIPYKVIGFAHGLEASKGERFKENEPNDPAKTRKIFAKKINQGLLEGYEILDDVSRPVLLKNSSKAEMLSRKKICLSIFTPRDWNLLNELMFPGALDSPEIIQNRANDMRDDALLEVSEVGDTDTSSD